jgi:VCBS repeat-containing protein
VLRDIAIGHHIPSIKIEGVNTSGQAVYDLTLADVTLTQLHEGNGGNDSLSFDYQKVALVTQAQNANGTLSPAGSFSFDVATNQIDAGSLPTPSPRQGDHLVAVLDSTTAHGNLNLNPDGSFSYTPDANFNGTDSFVYHATDGVANTNDVTVAINVAPVNDAPVAANGSASGPEDNPVLGHVVATDIDSSALSYSLVGVDGGAQHGTVSMSTDGSFTYVPAANFDGIDTFAFKANDGSLDSNIALVDITVTPVNDAPVFTSPTTFIVPENNTAVGAITAVDPEHDAFSFALTGGADKPFFSIDAHTGALSFINSPDFETPADANHDNIYDLMLSVTDVFGATNTEAISVDVTNVVEVGQIINGGNGNNVLTGTTGNDTINSGNGNDRLDGGDGDDIIFSGNGNDMLIGGRGNDKLDGGNGDDLLDGGVGNNQLSGGNGNDILQAGDGNNVLDGGNGNDVLSAGNGNNNLTGGNGDDTLTVGNGNNSLSGGNGNDILKVGLGNNVLIGGNGNDTFVFGPSFSNDVITDFSHGDHVEFDGGVFQNVQAVQLAAHQAGADTVIGVGAETITLQNVVASSLHTSDFIVH